MKLKKITPYFKRWRYKLKKIKKNKSRLIVFALVVAGILTICFLGFYFKALIEKEGLEAKKELERTLQQLGRRAEPQPPGEVEEVSPETIFKLRKSGIERYFLSKVELTGNYYIPLIHACLFKDGQPLYPLYLYGAWSLLYYPEEPFPQVALVRYLLLPEDNPNFRPDKACFIKEIKTEKDWQELKEKYGFLKDQFSTTPSR